MFLDALVEFVKWHSLHYSILGNSWLKAVLGMMVVNSPLIQALVLWGNVALGGGYRDNISFEQSLHFYHEEDQFVVMLKIRRLHQNI